jgi:catechol 2,3-dioxygenase-like lactoylglutathione lyase family enzyme
MTGRSTSAPKRKRVSERVHLGTVSHFSLAVNDPSASAAWWTSNFDLNERFRTETRVGIGNDSIFIGLFKGTPDPAVIGHLAFATANLDELKIARDLLHAGGVDLEDPGNEIGPVAPGSPSMGLWFRDLDGYRWELFVRVPESA